MGEGAVVFTREFCHRNCHRTACDESKLGGTGVPSRFKIVNEIGVFDT